MVPYRIARFCSVLYGIDRVPEEPYRADTRRHDLKLILISLLSVLVNAGS